MHFFLYEIVARVVAIYLCFDCCRKIRQGILERKTTWFNSDFLDWSPNWIAHRDAAPIRYWIQIGLQIVAFIACLVVATFGWLPTKA